MNQDRTNYVSTNVTKQSRKNESRCKQEMIETVKKMTVPTKGRFVGTVEEKRVYFCKHRIVCYNVFISNNYTVKSKYFIALL